jgi:predicted metal-dependent phosphoesterase TrpH
MTEYSNPHIKPSPKYLRTEFHCHTVYSNDCLTSPEKLIETCRRKGIKRVMVTDHDSIEGGLRCKEIDPTRVIVGEEIMTTQGELLAAYVTNEIPNGLEPMEAITQLRDQNAFISVSHPFDAHRKGSWEVGELLKILPHVDAIETFNARCMLPRFNFQAQDFAAEFDVLGTYGSDAHSAFELGRGTLLLPPFDDSESLKAALRKAVVPKIILSTPIVHFISTYAKWRKNFFQKKGGG